MRTSGASASAVAIKLGGAYAGAFARAITPHGTMAYTSDSRNGTVTPIRIATNIALKPIRAGKRPDAIAITPALNTRCERCV